MIVLGIDTSGYINAVGVVNGTRVLADNRFPARTDTLEQIVDNIDSTLKQAGVSFKDVEGIGVGLGPGSWTGIKVGVTVGKMLAFSADKPVAGIPTLDALAFGVPDKSLPVWVVISAGVKDMVYAAQYRFKENEPVREGEYYAGDARGLSQFIRGQVILAGPNAGYYRGVILGQNEPARYKPEAGKEASAGNNLHNVNIGAIYEPAQDKKKRDSYETIETSPENEPAQSQYVVKGSGSLKSNDSDRLTVFNDGNNNEPAQSGTGNVVYASDISYLDIEPAGAWVALLALLRLQRGVQDNPQGLTPMYLKESTAKVFVNKYMAKQ